MAQQYIPFRRGAGLLSLSQGLGNFLGQLGYMALMKDEIKEQKRIAKEKEKLQTYGAIEKLGFSVFPSSAGEQSIGKINNIPYYKPPVKLSEAETIRGTQPKRYRRLAGYLGVQPKKEKLPPLTSEQIEQARKIELVGARSAEQIRREQIRQQNRLKLLKEKLDNSIKLAAEKAELKPTDPLLNKVASSMLGMLSLFNMQKLIESPDALKEDTLVNMMVDMYKIFKRVQDTIAPKGIPTGKKNKKKTKSNNDPLKIFGK